MIFACSRALSSDSRTLSRVLARKSFSSISGLTATISPSREGSGLPLSITPGRIVAMTGLFSGQTIFTIMFPRQPGTTITS